MDLFYRMSDKHAVRIQAGENSNRIALLMRSERSKKALLRFSEYANLSYPSCRKVMERCGRE